MSVQSNQYLIYGLYLDYKIYAELYDETLERFCDSAFNSEKNPGGLHCLFDGMNGDYIVLGRCLAKSQEGSGISFFEITELDDDFKTMTELLVKAETGLGGQFGLYLINHLR